MTGDEAAERLGWSPSKISRMENAKSTPKRRDLRRIFEVYGVADDERASLVEIAEEAEQKGWWEQYRDSLPADYTTLLGLEAEASVVRVWEPQLIFGMFQTENYAREVIRASQTIIRFPPSDLRSRVEARMTRQELMTRDDDPLTILAVLDESVLLRQFGTKDDMNAQLRHLIEVSARENVRLQVLPLRTDGHPVNTGSFLHLKIPEYPDVVYLEGLHGARFIEEEDLAYRYEVAFDHLIAAALSPQDTRQRIASTLENEWM